MQPHPETLRQSIDAFWDAEILPALIEYIKIPNKSVHFDPDWESHGYMEEARRLAVDWLRAHPLPGAVIHDLKQAGRSPLILVEVPGGLEQTVLIYGHLDKQPEMEGWHPDGGPWTPVLKDGKLYGRGGADDGYALFAAVAAIRALDQAQRPRIVILIEFSEESGSPDLPAYLEECGPIIGEPALVIALDSGAGDYERLWSTTSLRGLVNAVLDVRVLEETCHSGIASGIVPSSLRILRQLLDRIEDPVTGACRVPELNAPIPEPRRQQARAAATVLGNELLNSFSVVPGLRAVATDPVELLLNNTWRPTLCVVGQDGMPPLASAGNILCAHTAFKLSIRLPPIVPAPVAEAALSRVLLADPPHGARVTLTFEQGSTGWDAPPLAPWLEQATREASACYFGQDPVYIGLGASIPFMSMLGERFPEAQFLITGVLGPKSNAHGPNEFLHIEYARKLTAAVAFILGRMGLAR
jgi:acetylornithine deacetylase/succinyl-diaminopimelate desuccinylase-like protein